MDGLFAIADRIQLEEEFILGQYASFATRLSLPQRRLQPVLPKLSDLSQTLGLAENAQHLAQQVFLIHPANGGSPIPFIGSIAVEQRYQQAAGVYTNDVTY
jgi:hypothetical protein